jgi:hypothetical protein
LALAGCCPADNLVGRDDTVTALDDAAIRHGNLPLNNGGASLHRVYT